MASKFSSASFNVANLRGILVNSRIQQDNRALYQFLNDLINGLGTFDNNLQGKLSASELIDLEGQVEGLLPISNGGTLTQKYLPVLDNTANITASAAFYTWYSRIGNLVHVSGKFTIEPTDPATLTQLEFLIPIASKFEHSEQLNGVANGVPFAGSTNNFSAIIKANPANGKALLEFYSVDAVDHDVRFELTYQFIPTGV